MSRAWVGNKQTKSQYYCIAGTKQLIYDLLRGHILLSDKKFYMYKNFGRTSSTFLLQRCQIFINYIHYKRRHCIAG